ncbi:MULTISPECIES: hypothetical protein [Actinomadura]|uniref:SGNH/GDSL hydrolase family protein n=1 Tax=Actinomadura yumaensis TaxID=111807 RepID=A0ABW2CSM5_9ACTN|nr:hypothetical protein [Actinomadura sp. J1-007]MWK36280.1 hypothetical protein [Actinomadura sp. J1-007]
MDVRFKISAVAVTIAVVVGFLFYVQRDSSGGYEPYHGPLATPGGPAAKQGATLHIALNTQPSDYPRLRELGYDLVDVKPDDALVNGVPDGMRALLWVGNFTCGAFELPYDAFTDAVRRLARHPKVYGWYLSDEPNPRECPRVAQEIRRRADYIERNAPGQISFVSLTDWPMGPVTPAKVNVDLVGLDPYPCKGAAKARPDCDIDAIDRMVRMADDAGIPREAVVPVFQTFGQGCSKGERQYWLPTEEQLRQLLSRWDKLTPRPMMDVSYSWGRQGEWACPTLADAPGLQQIMKARNGAR